MGVAGEYHRVAGGASRRPCPLCGKPPDRLGRCADGHAAVRVSGSTHAFVDHRDNLVIDRDAAAPARRHARGRRLGHEHSHEALAWNVFRSLEACGLAAHAATALAGPPDGAEVTTFYWGLAADGAPYAPLADARAALEPHLRGPDKHASEPDVVLVDAGARRVIVVDVCFTSPVASPPPAWFAAAATPAAQRRRRAVLDGLVAEEGDGGPFRRGLADAVRRGFAGPARRLLVARAVARRLGYAWRGLLVTLASPATSPAAAHDARRFDALLRDGAAHRFITFAQLYEALRTPAVENDRTWQALARYLSRKTANGLPAHMI